MNDNRRIKQAFEEGTRIDAAMNRAFYAAVRLHRMHDVPLVLWEEGQVRYVSPFDIELPDEAPVSAPRTEPDNP